MTTCAPLQFVIPVFNDWASVQRLLPLIDAQLSRSADVLLVDDGSTERAPRTWDMPLQWIRRIRILRLVRNLGHQRAICVGLCHARSMVECERVVVMDGDGEDLPGDVPRLLAALERTDGVRIAFAERTKRSEGAVFTFFYALYRLLHVVLVGHRVRVGNFSAMTRECVDGLCVSSELWSHFAAAAFASRQSMVFVRTRRGRRLTGRSSMNFPALVMHGLSALAVFSDRIGTRLLVLALCTTGVMLAGMTTVGVIRLMTPYAIPGWATMAMGILTLLLGQILAFVVTFCFMILFFRAVAVFIPARDYQYFVSHVEELRNGAVVD
jgi:glycosyltransferase involved in cell wall biosynthesis